ncbi:hypothetical protein [Devosia sp.]|uniref:hypothetical protein n=1 Tax=Devosia sp. TaxID=1871048 RepID=UPI001AC6ECF0|nr:hypothetical protein [Devosia sp.]MBN9333860.1 hypothetical protein [Devosia sp.]
MPGRDPEKLIEEARRLNGQARHHKRESGRHRKAAQSAREKQAEIERQCAALGITVTYEPGKGPLHGHRTDPRPFDADR